MRGGFTGILFDLTNVIMWQRVWAYRDFGEETRGKETTLKI
jgi:hypothetical protein